MGVKFSISMRGVLVILLVMLSTSIVHAAIQEQVLHSFGSGRDGAEPSGALVFDAAGNLYGETRIGGASEAGTVFELTPNGDGTWTEEVLYSFGSQSHDGAYPSGGLVFDAAGNLYGTTQDGGGTLGCTGDCGRVFELTPNGDGTWTETTLYIFVGNPDGSDPLGGLIIDSAGNLYGTTQYGGPYAYGTVFELTPNGNGTWTEQILHSFRGYKTDGRYPRGGLVRDAAGNLYGTTFNGGSTYQYGAVFGMKPKAGGGWDEGLLHSFTNNSTDGNYPESRLVLDAAGHLYGTTYEGGALNGGVVFELGRKPGGAWEEVILHDFKSYNHHPDGACPLAGLTFDANGDLVGTTTIGGAYDYGTVFGMKRKAGGGWDEGVLYSFSESSDGYSYSLVVDAAGNLYGITYVGGAYGSGTVFEITP
jgi:uncharacterized repeat protein (TIGR03803 family)